MSENFTEIASKLLCPPGRGVYTVHTASDKKEKLDQLLYQLSKSDEALVREEWLKKLQTLKDYKGVAILGVCSDTGGGIQRGANWGPLMVRVALAENQRLNHCLDLGDVRVVPHLLHDKYLNQETLSSVREALYGDSAQKLPVSPLSITEEAITSFMKDFPHIPLFGLGGDHSVSYAFVGPYLKARREQGVKAGLLHFDAHTDLMTKRLGIDLCFGSWVPHILDLLPSGAACAQVGIRSTGREKEHWESTFGLKQYWAQEVKEKGALATAELIKDQFKSQGVEQIYVSFDIDALDLSFAAATGTPESEGLAPHECLLIMQELEKDFPITGADLVEVAPFVQFEFERSPMEQTLNSAQIIAGYLIEALSRSCGDL